MDKLVTLKPEEGRDLIDMMDEAEGKVRTLYHAVDGAMIYSEELSTTEMGRGLSSLLMVIKEYTRTIRADLDEVMQVLMHSDANKAAAPKGGAKK